KAAIVAFTRCLALEIGTRNVNVNCVAPGATRTALIADIADDLMEKIRASIPKGRIGEIDDIVTIVRVPRIRRGALIPRLMHQSEWWRHLFFDRDNGMQKSFANVDLEDRPRACSFLRAWTRQPIGMAK